MSKSNKSNTKNSCFAFLTCSKKSNNNYTNSSTNSKVKGVVPDKQVK